MYLPEFCKYLCDEGLCDCIKCKFCPIDKLILEKTNFKIEFSDRPMGYVKERKSDD